jgi:LTXXQ motif family protein
LGASGATCVSRAFLCTFIRVLLRIAEASQLQLPRSGPDGQPNESSQLATLCDRQAASFTKLPVQGIEEIVRSQGKQQTACENLKQASTQAADELRTSCPAQTAATPVARLDAAGNRLQALVQAAKTVRPTLGAFYASLSDEQKARFNSMGQQNGTRSESATGIR